MASNTKHNTVFVSTSCIPGKEPIASRISLYQRHGIEAIEFSAGVSTEGDSLSQVVELGGPFLVHNYFPPPHDSFVLNLASVDDNIRRRSLDMVFEALELTARLSAPFYGVHAGFITDPTHFGTTSFVFPMPASAEEEAAATERFIESLKLALDHGRQFGVQLIIENNVCSHELRGKLLLQTADEFLSLFQAVSSPDLGMLLDTGHLNVTARTFGFDPMAFVEKVAPYVRALHVHENDGTADYHQPVEPGSWILDVISQPRFANLPITLETKFEDIADVARHADWIRGVSGRI